MKSVLCHNDDPQTMSDCKSHFRVFELLRFTAFGVFYICLKFYITDYKILNGDTATQNEVALMPSACDWSKITLNCTEITSGIMVDIFS